MASPVGGHCHHQGLGHQAVAQQETPGMARRWEDGGPAGKASCEKGLTKETH
jgi:hypothetical protein